MTSGLGTIQAAVQPVDEMAYRNVVRNGMTAKQMWPIHTASSEAMPFDVDALLVASDLQGHEWQPRNDRAAPRLVGVALAEYLSDAGHHACTNPDRTGVLLAGDLFAEPLKRGGLGDCDAVWRAFADRFAWVVGVFGNHDLVAGKTVGDTAGQIYPNAFVLDGDCFESGSGVIAGVGGVIGKAGKPNRWTQDQYEGKLIEALSSDPDILILHEPPYIPKAGGKGSEVIADWIETLAWSGTIVCGHCIWEEWLCRFSPEVQVLNAEGRAIVIRRSD